MTSRARKILDEACSLTETERTIVAVELGGGRMAAPDDVRMAWVKEAVARLEELERGEVELLPHAEVQAEIERILLSR